MKIALTEDQQKAIKNKQKKNTSYDIWLSTTLIAKNFLYNIPKQNTHCCLSSNSPPPLTAEQAISVKKKINKNLNAAGYY